MDSYVSSATTFRTIWIFTSLAVENSNIRNLYIVSPLSLGTYLSNIVITTFYFFFRLLKPINATRALASKAVGSDISIWAGVVPTGSLLNANKKYFWFHHTQADRMDVLDPDALDKATAVWAAVSYVIADLSEEFPRDFNNSENAPGPSLLERLQLRKRD